jgi:hypothetical protein
MPKIIRNLDYIRAKDPRLFEALSDLIQQHQNVAQQVNGNPIGGPLPPPSIDGVNVTGQNGHFHIQIQHRADIYRGIHYYAEFANNPGFADPHTIHMGDSREHTQFLGNGTYYWRAYAAYAASSPSAPAYHGGAVRPQPVSGGGIVGGPALLPPQGSGTGIAGEGLSGPGPVAFRSSNGVPPKRGKSGSGPGGGTTLLPSPETGLPEGIASAGAIGGTVAGPLPDAKIWIGNASSQPVAQSLSADATLADTGALTLATVNASPGTYGDSSHVAQVTVNGKGLVTAVASVAIAGTSGFSGTVVLAALTGGGTTGSLTVVNGLITAYVAPT